MWQKLWHAKIYKVNHTDILLIFQNEPNTLKYVVFFNSPNLLELKVDHVPLHLNLK